MPVAMFGRSGQMFPRRSFHDAIYEEEYGSEAEEDCCCRSRGFSAILCWFLSVIILIGLAASIILTVFFILRSRNLLSKTGDGESSSFYDGILDGGVHYPELNWKDNKDFMDKKESHSSHIPTYDQGKENVETRNQQVKKSSSSDRFSLSNLFEKKDNSDEILKPSSKEHKSSHRPSTERTSTEDIQSQETFTTTTLASAGQKILFTMSPSKFNTTTYRPPRKKERTRISEKTKITSSVSYSSSSSGENGSTTANKNNNIGPPYESSSSSSSEEIFTNSHGVPPTVKHTMFTKAKSSTKDTTTNNNKKKIDTSMKTSSSTEDIKFSRPIKTKPSLASSEANSTGAQNVSDENEPIDILARIIKNLAPKWSPRTTTTTTTQKPMSTSKPSVKFSSKEASPPINQNELPNNGNNNDQATTYRPPVVHFEPPTLGGQRGGHPPIKIIPGSNLSHRNSQEETKQSPGLMDQFLDILVGSTQGGSENTLVKKQAEGGIVTSAIVPPWFENNERPPNRGPPMLRRRPMLPPPNGYDGPIRGDQISVPTNNMGNMRPPPMGPHNRPLFYGPPPPVNQHRYPQNSQEPYYIDSSQQVTSADDAFHIKSEDGTTNIYGYIMDEDESSGEQLGLESEPLTGEMIQSNSMEISPTHTINLTYENSGSPEIIIEQGAEQPGNQETAEYTNNLSANKFIPTETTGSGVRKPISREEIIEDMKTAGTDHHPQVVMEAPKQEEDNLTERQDSGENEYEYVNADVVESNELTNDNGNSYDYQDEWIPSQEKKVLDEKKTTSEPEKVYTVYSERYGDTVTQNVTSTTIPPPVESAEKKGSFVPPPLVDFHETNNNKYTTIRKEIFHDRDGWRPLVRDETSESQDNAVSSSVIHTFESGRPSSKKPPVFEKQYLHREDNTKQIAGSTNSQESYNGFAPVQPPSPIASPIPARHKFPDSEEWNEDMRHRQRLQAQHAMATHVQPMFHHKGIIDRSKYMVRPAPPPIMMRRKPHRNMPFLSNMPPRRRQLVPRIQRKTYDSSVEYNVKKFPPRPTPAERFKTLRARPRSNTMH